MTARTRRAADVLIAAALLAFAALYYNAAAQLPSNLLEDPVGAAGLPLLIAGVIGLLSAVLLAQSLLGLRRAGEADAAEADGDDRAAVLPAAKMFLLGVAFLILLPLAGYLVSVGVLLLATFLLQGLPWSARTVAVAVAGGAALYVTFRYGLGVRLPGLAPGWL